MSSTSATSESVHRSSSSRRVRVGLDVMDIHTRVAEANRARLDAAGCLTLNLMSGPGAGKTSLLVETLSRLAPEAPCAVIEGDQETDHDAARIRATGVPALQVNTKAGCHLEAEMLFEALDRQPPPAGGYLFVENVGNLVCPAGFPLGDHRRVVLLCVTDGEDKPLKYPYIFAKADLVLLSKIDLEPHLGFDRERCEAWLRRVNPTAPLLAVSTRTGQGLEDWLGWLRTTRETYLSEQRTFR